MLSASLCVLALIAALSGFYASLDDEVLKTFGNNITVYPSSFKCEHALVYSADCMHSRRLHGHGGHSGGHSHTSHTSSSNAVAYTTHAASTSSKKTIIAGSIFYLHLNGNWATRLPVAFDEDFQYCGEISNVINNTIEFPGSFVSACDRDKIGFWKSFFNGSICIALLVVAYCAYNAVVACTHKMFEGNAGKNDLV